MQVTRDIRPEQFRRNLRARFGARFFAVLIGFSSLAGCSTDSEPYAAYDGDAYPNQRPQYEPNGRLLGYVANRMSDSISVIDLDAMALLGSSPIGRDPVDIDGARHVVLDEERELAYVVLSYPLDIPSAHVEPGQEIPERASYVQALDLTDFRPLGEVRVEPNAEELALSRDRNQLLVSHYDTTRALKLLPASIATIDDPWRMVEGTAAARMALACIAPAALVYSPDDSRAYAICAGEDALAVLETENGTVIARTPTGEAVANKSYALSLAPSGQQLLVSNQLTRAVTLFAARDEPQLLRTIFLPGIPFFAAWLSATEVIVPLRDGSGAARVNVETGEVLHATVYANEDCENPGEARLSADGRVFLACEGDHYRPGSVVQLDAQTLEILATVTVGIYPDRLALREP